MFMNYHRLEFLTMSFSVSPILIWRIIGVDLYSQIVADKPHSFRKGNPSAVETAFGWIILGPIDKHVNNLNDATSLLASVYSSEAWWKQIKLKEMHLY